MNDPHTGQVIHAKKTLLPTHLAVLLSAVLITAHLSSIEAYETRAWCEKWIGLMFSRRTYICSKEYTSIAMQ